MSDADWEREIADAWATADSRSDDQQIELMERLGADSRAAGGAGVYERAGAYDSGGHSDIAVPLYREALGLGLDGSRRRQATIQLASSLRNLGQAEESVALLEAELAHGSAELEDQVRAFLALALVDAGREREAVSIALTALAPHVTRYQRSIGNYARLLIHPEDAE